MHSATYSRNEIFFIAKDDQGNDFVYLLEEGADSFTTYPLLKNNVLSEQLNKHGYI